MIVIGLLMGVVAIAAVLGGSRKETPRKDASAKMEE